MLAQFLLLTSIGTVALFQLKAPQERLTDKVVFEFNETFNSYSANTLRATSFGYNRAFSGLLWLRFLQQTPPKKVGLGQVSWIYRDLDAVTELDPMFFPAYEQGGIFLSVITEDKRGAEQILLKGIRRFPESWRLKAYLSYHYEYELNDPKRSGELLVEAAKLQGAPPLIAIRAATFLSRKSGTEESIRFLQEMMDSAANADVKERLKEKIRSLREGKK